MGWGQRLAWGMIVTAFVASTCYYADGNVRQGTYWLAAGVLNLCVTV